MRIDATLYGEGSAEREDQLLFALRALVARVADDVGYSGQRCGLLRLELECEDGEKRELPVALALPTSQAATMFDLVRARLEGVTLQSPVVGLRLGAEDHNQEHREHQGKLHSPGTQVPQKNFL